MPIPQTLKTRLKERRVVPFVGAGVSMAVQNKETGHPLFPSWKQLLESAISLLEADDQKAAAMIVKGLLEESPPEYLEAAKRAQKSLQGRLYKLLKGQIDREQSKAQDSSLELARLVWELGSPLVITTNYDRVLEWTAPSKFDCSVLDNHAKVELRDLLSSTPTRSTVWHLHGRISDASNLILTPDGYERLYPSSNSGGTKTDFEAALQTLNSLIASRTLLFIGYSMDDEYLTKQLEATRDLYAGSDGPHYALISERQREQVIRLGIPVQVISYESHGEPLLKMLREMAEEIEEPDVTVRPVKTTPPTNSVADFSPRHATFYIPYRPKGERVLGRDTQLSKVREQLTSGKPTAIGQAASFQGIGGLGKTQLAVEYAHKFKSEYPNGVIWISADGDIDSQLTELAERAGWVSPQAEHETKLQIALRRVKSYSDTLLIFDNVEDLASIKPYLPEYPAEPHILITSRTAQVGFTSIPLELLDKPTSFQLLIQEANRVPTDESEGNVVREIVDMLGDLPLAIELAGAFIQNRAMEWKDYRDLLRDNLPAALPSQFSSFTRHEADLYRTLHIDETIFTELPLLREILDVLTWSGPTPMGRDLLCALLDVDPIKSIEPLAVGVSLRLLQKTPDSESYAIHRLVRQVRRTETPLATRTNWVEVVASRLGNWFETKREHSSQLLEFERQIEHVAAWQQHANKLALQECVRLLWLQAYPPYHRGRYPESKSIVDQALRLYKKMGVDKKDLEAHLLVDASFLEERLGNSQEAAIKASLSVAIRREFLGNMHRDTANAIRNLGDILSSQNKISAALVLIKEAMEIQKSLEDVEKEEIVVSLKTISNVYMRSEDFESALFYIESAIRIYNEINIDKKYHVPVSAAGLLNTLARVKLNTGHEEESIEIFKESLETHRKNLGDIHPNTANAMMNIGTAYLRTGDVKAALEFYGKSFVINQEIFGERSRAVSIVKNRIASAYEKDGNLQSAKENFKFSSEIISNTDTLIDADGINCIMHYVVFLWKNCEYSESLKVIEDLISRMPNNHPLFKDVEKQALIILMKVKNVDRKSKVLIIYKQKWRQRKKVSVIP